MRRWRRVVRLRLRSLLHRDVVDRELDEELQYHLERQIDEYVAAGMPPADARFAALKAMGAPVGPSMLFFGCRHPEQDYIYADELADFAGLKAEVAAVTRRAMNGELDFVAALEARVALGHLLERVSGIEPVGDGKWEPRKGLHVHGPNRLPIRFRSCTR